MNVMRNVKTLEKVQRSSLLGITGAPQSTPTASLEMILNHLPIDLFIKRVAFESATRLQCLGHWNHNGGLRGHETIFSVLPSDPRPLGLKYDDIMVKYDFTIPWNVILSFEHSASHSGNTYVYTTSENSTENAKIGVRCSDPVINMSLRVENHLTLHLLGVIAIHQAVKKLLEYECTNSVIFIVSQIQSSLNVLQSSTIKSKTVDDCRTDLKTLSCRNVINLIWVSDLNSSLGVTETYRHLPEGSTDYTTLDICTGVSLTYTKKKIRECFNTSQLNRWHVNGISRDNKILVPNPCDNISNQILKLGRHNLGRLVGLLTGHCLLRYRQHKLKLRGDPFCRGCEVEVENTTHFLCHCPTLTALRQSHLGLNHFQTLSELKNSATLLNILAFMNSTEWL